MLAAAVFFPIPRAGAEITSRDSVLLWAAGRNLLGLAELVVSRGGRTDERDLMGNTPLHAAAKYPDMIKLLLRSGADVNARNSLGETPLHKAVRHRDSVEVLLAAGADAGIRDEFGRTAVDACMDGGPGAYNTSIMRLLLTK